MPIDKREALKQIEDVLSEFLNVQGRMDYADDEELYLQRAIIARMGLKVSDTFSLPIQRDSSSIGVEDRRTFSEKPLAVHQRFT